MKDGHHKPPTFLAQHRKTLSDHPILIAPIAVGLTTLVGVPLLAIMFQLGGTSITHPAGTTQSPARTSSPSQASNQGSLTSATGSQTNSAPNVSSYTSTTGSIKFSYNSSQFGISENGDKIIISPLSNPQITQWVEVLPKSAGDTIQQAITKDVLAGYNPTDCPIVSALTDGYQYASNFQSASIVYNTNNVDQYGNVINLDKCPVQYTNQSESRLYFLVDANHPDKLLFFHLNGIGFGVNATQEWQDTITLH